MDVEEEDTTSYLRVTNFGVNIEEDDTTTFLRVSDFAVMVEMVNNLGDYCGPGDINLVTYLQFSRGLHCYLSREADEVGLSITGALTLGGWVLFGTKGRGHKTAIMGKWYEPTDDRAYVLYKENDNQIKFEISKTGINDLNSASDLGIHYDVNQWHYIVGRFKPSEEIALFIDGNWYKNTLDIFDSIHDSDEPFEIARANRDNYFDGKLCHMFVSAEAIDDIDIEMMYYHTKAMFVSPGEEPFVPSGINERITNTALMIEYQPHSYLRVTDAALMVEYEPPTYNRMTNEALMIEYRPTNFEYLTNVALMIEYQPKDYLRETNIALMIEYYSSSSSSSSSTSSSSTTTSSSSSTEIP